MRLIIILFACVFLTGGKCNSIRLNETEARAIDQATDNNEIVAADLRDNRGLTAHADIIDDQNRVVRGAMGPLPEELNAPPTVDPANLKTDPQGEAEKSGTDADETLDDIEASNEGFWSKALAWAKGGGLVALGLTACRLLAGVHPVFATALQFINGPMGKIADKVTGGHIAKGKAKQTELEVEVAAKAAAIDSSMVGRMGIAALDRALGDKVADEILKLTNGRAETIEGVFKLLAKGHASDNGNGAAVKAAVDESKDRIPTEGGEASIIDLIVERISDG